MKINQAIHFCLIDFFPPLLLFVLSLDLRNAVDIAAQVSSAVEKSLNSHLFFSRKGVYSS
ncbi:MAG: hypothetical protein J5806_10840 [Lentisphaeria bacterium]|nr:hypothetical protein [Lentisphaeria bacterium]